MRKTKFTKTLAVTPETHSLAKVISERTGIRLGDLVGQAIRNMAAKVKK